MGLRWTNRNAFTLVELLVVITIIGILAALLVPAIRSGIRRAEITRAMADMHAISAAIKAYFKEYGIMPTPDTNGFADHTFIGKKGGTSNNPRQQRQIMDILRDVDSPWNPAHSNNPGRIVFLEVPRESMESRGGHDKDGFTYSVADGYFLDPWGNPYVIVMDTDFDGQIGGFNAYLGYASLQQYIQTNSPTGHGTYPGVTVGVMSYGPDPGSVESFLKSW